MQSKKQFCNLISGTIARAATVALAIATVFALTVVLAQSAQAQTFKVLHTFTGGADGASPLAGVTMDEAGNLYGTTSAGGGSGDGTVFRLSKKGSNWILNPLYTFTGGNDGGSPWATVVFGPDGNLYGTTTYGGEGGCDYGLGCGTVFQLKPFPTACKTAVCGWQETVLYRFTGGSDGANPGYGDLIFDQAGNLYGTTAVGGNQGGLCSNFGGCGVVFELTPSYGGWTEKVLYSFTESSDGFQPYAGLIFDNAGNLYGTTVSGGFTWGDCDEEAGCGVVFELTPSNGGWTENVLYTFYGGNDGDNPYAGLIFDASGNLYGATPNDGEGNRGTIFKLTPSGGGWIFSVVYSFTGGGGPAASLTMDAAGNLYGTTNGGGAYGAGNVFKLTPSGGGWTYTSLHDFTGGSDGSAPDCNVIFDANGNLYGTTVWGGSSQNCYNGCGVVWEITP